jgi:hypothetical protein
VIANSLFVKSRVDLTLLGFENELSYRGLFE